MRVVEVLLEPEPILREDPGSVDLLLFGNVRTEASIYCSMKGIELRASSMNGS